jgi:hypothetical protein
MCVCVGASDTTTTSIDPFTQSFAVCAERFPRESQGGGGAGMPPPGYVQRSGQRPKIYFWAVFDIFSGFCYF